MGKLEGKVALITGGARGQGRSHAVGLAEEGADIVVVDLCRQIDTVAYPMAAPGDLRLTVELVEALDRRILAVEGDVRDLTTMRTLVDRTLAELGRLDIVLANAGIMPTVGPYADRDEAFTDCVDVMLTGVFNTVRAAAPVLVEQGHGGSIVITSSTAGVRGLFTHQAAGSAGYAAAKHGVVGLMRVYANLLAPHHIRVNTVHPTGVNSPMISNQVFADFAEEFPVVAGMLQNPLPVPLIECEDVTAAIRWLVSDDARYVTGACLPVDAGFLVRP